MKNTLNNKRLLTLMIASQVLLTLFVLYWLRSQYFNEKTRLVNEITGLYIDTQDEIVDTMLFRSYVNPVLSGTRNHEFDRQVTATDSVKLDSVFIKGPREIEGMVKWKGTNGAITVRMESETDSVSDTIKIRKTNDEMLLRSVRLFVTQTRDSMKMDERVVRSLIINPDTAVFIDHFQNRLSEAGMKLNLTWDDRKEAVPEPRKLINLNIDTPFSLPAVSVTGYQGYLLSKILPQVLFGLILILITALAFIFSYRSIREHIILAHQKNEFISNITHELKTPVATISVALESLGKYNMRYEPEVMDEYIKLALFETIRLEELINRVLDHSLLEENVHSRQFIISDLNTMISEVAGVMKQRLEDRGQIEFIPSGERINILCDPLFLKGVLINLVDNSIKYCDKAPVIKIISGTESGYAIVNVIDNGPGIPAEYHKKIFEKFFRIPTGNLHNVKGYGLGLSFAALVMKQHNGSIEVKNCDQGCSIILKIPVAL